MEFIRLAINNPVKVSAGVILLLLFGMLSFFNIPIQLTPDVDQPQVTVTTRWFGASPQEIENEIIEPQEEKLKGVTNLRKMTSSSKRGEATITLEFNVGVEKDAALRDTIEKIAQVSGYPDEVDRPAVVAADAALDSTIAWLMFRAEHVDDISTMRDFVEDKVKPLLDRVPGVGSTDIYGGREREVQVQIDPALMAARRITFNELNQALRGQNRNISAGTISQGKREYTFRTVGEYGTIEDVESTVVADRNGGPVFVGDIATVVMSHQKQYSMVRSRGQDVLAIPVNRETGANVIATMEALKAQIRYINETLLAPRPEGMSLTQVYDETVYITSSINLVIQNIFVGGLLAAIVLLLFLRSGNATLIVGISIPISVIGAFLAVTVLGRSLNVIMLAGMAFAVGMVVDNAVVVLENIHRHRENGAAPRDAALRGAHEVWGAVLASTLTTIAVFLPVIFIKEEAGQLFADIAIAISTAVALSLLVAVTVIPPLAARLLGRHRERPVTEGGGRIANGVAAMVEWVNRRIVTRVGVVVGLMTFALLGCYWLVPPASYLPNGNRNLVFGFLLSPPGYSLDEFRRVGRVFEGQLRPFWDAERGSVAAANLPVQTMRVGSRAAGHTVEVVPPPIENFFFVSFDGGAFMGGSSKEPAVVTPLVEALSGVGNSVPGIMAFFQQSSLFGRGLSGGNVVDLQLRCDDEAALIGSASALMGQLRSKYPRMRPLPSNFDLGRPEWQFRIDRVRAADLGLSVADIGFVVEACINGAYVGSFRDRGEEIDLVIKVPETEGLPATAIAAVPIFTTNGHTVPLSTVVDVDLRFEPQEIAHAEAMRSVNLQITPPRGLALEAVMNDIKDNFIAPLRSAGVVAPDVIVTMEGNADKLVQTRRALIGDYTGLFSRPRLLGASPAMSVLGSAGLVLLIAFGTWRWSPTVAVRIALLGLAALLIAVMVLNPQLPLELLQSRGVLAAVVIYLLMAALFESFVYPFVIMLSVPLATVGGFAGLALVHWLSNLDPIAPIQELDVLTMLGFVILIGIVVNNAILIIHQSLNNMRHAGMPPQEAVRESVRTRVRPIFMTALTSIGGMLPLVLMPGSGSELYRGLGSVLVGGLAVSTVFTLLLVPAMFSLLVDLRAVVRRGTVHPAAVATGSAPVVAAMPSAVGKPAVVTVRDR